MIRLSIRVTPHASRDEITGWRGEALKIKLRAPAVEGKANAALLRFLAQTFDLPERQCRLVHGDRGRDKVVELTGVSEEQVRQALPPAP